MAQALLDDVEIDLERRQGRDSGSIKGGLRHATEVV
jgi:hypothetical protein